MLQKKKTKSIFKVRNLKSPRVIKTHLALDMLPNQACVFIGFIHLLNQVKVLNAWVPCAFDNLSEYHFQSTGVGEESESDICDKKSKRCSGMLFSPPHVPTKIH